MTFTPTPDGPASTSPPIDYERLHGLMVDRDVEHIRILSICWYVVSGLAVLMGCVPIIHVTLGVMMLQRSGPFAIGAAPPPPPFMGWLFVLMGSGMMLFGWTTAILGFLTARSLPQRRRLWLCYVAAALVCLQVPIGTTLGVFTFVVLSRASIKATFH